MNYDDEVKKIELAFNKKMNELKQHYKIDFEIDYFNNKTIKNIKFLNLKFKDDFSNMSIIYDNVNRQISSINYSYTDIRTIKNLKYKKIIPYFFKEYNIELVIKEINRINLEYLNNIDNYK